MTQRYRLAVSKRRVRGSAIFEFLGWVTLAGVRGGGIKTSEDIGCAYVCSRHTAEATASNIRRFDSDLKVEIEVVQ